MLKQPIQLEPTYNYGTRVPTATMGQRGRLRSTQDNSTEIARVRTKSTTTTTNMLLYIHAGVERDGRGQAGGVHPRHQRVLPARDRGVLQPELLQGPSGQD